MGIVVFWLVVGPFVALLYFPLDIQQEPRSRRAARAPYPSASLPSAASKGLNAIEWTRSAEEHFRQLRNAA